MAELDDADIFSVARRLNHPTEREAYLRHACRDDAMTYERVAVLLRAYDAEPQFLDSPPTELGLDTDSAAVAEGPGTVIGRYQLVERIGEGGFAAVYMAHQSDPICRQVALKIVKLGMDTRQVIARFEAERQALAVMDHPGIAKVYDAGVTDTGRPFFVMELIRGVPITQFCDDNRLTIEERLQLFQDVCRAVQHAHQKGIIHRDIKPTNILVSTHDGKPVAKVIDFGIAKATHQRLTEKTLYTSLGQIIGTPQYMSPEQAAFSDLDIDTRSDVYALGVLLYELLTGTTPFKPSEQQRQSHDGIYHAIRHDDPPAPSRSLTTLGETVNEASRLRQTDPPALRKRLRGDLDCIVMKALEKERANRYDTADALALDVERHIAGESIQARHISTANRVWRWCKRNRLTAVLSLTIAGLIALVAIGAPFVAWHQARLVEDTRQQLYVKDVAMAYNAWNEGDLGYLGELLNRYRDGSQWEHFRDFPWYYLNGMHQRATNEFMPAARFDISHRANLLAVGRPDQLIHLFDIESWEEIGTIPWKHPVMAAIRLSPDGRLVAAAHENGTVTVSDVASRKHIYTMSVGSYAAALYVPVFSPDSSLLATGGPDDVARVWDATTGKELHVLPHSDTVSILSFSPDGTTLATACFDGTLRFWDTTTWQPRVVVDDAHNGRVYALAYDASGKLALGGWGDDVSLWDTTGKLLKSIPVSGAGSLYFSPDGQFLAIGGDQQGTVHVWDCHEDKLHQQFLVGHISATVAFLQNGELLFESDDKLMRRNLDQSSLPAADRETRRRDEKIKIAISPTGDLMVAGYGKLNANPGEGAIACWDFRGNTSRQLSGHDGSSVFDVAIDPTGELIIAGGGPSRGPGFIVQSDRHSGKLAPLLPTQATSVGSVAVSPQGNRLAVGCEGAVSVWKDFDSRPELLWRRDLQGWIHVAFSASGDVLAVVRYRSDATGPTVDICNPESGEQLDSIPFNRSVTDFAFSPDDRLLASIAYNGNVEVYDREERRIIFSELAHGRAGFGLAFSFDGRTLATGSSNGEVKFWHVPTMMLMTTIKTRGRVADLAFFPDGDTLAIGYSDRTIELWHVDREVERFDIDAPAAE